MLCRVVRTGTLFFICGLLLSACSSSGGGCKEDGECPGGRYCLVSSGECIFDCTFSDDCISGFTCTARGRCIRECEPEAEQCDGLDNDCDGQTDEELTGQDCVRENGFGSCAGVQRCTAGIWDCDASEPAAETCDGRDENCDGSADEDIAPRDCVAQNEFGTCSGQETCQAGVWQCGALEPMAELCDGLDNNCDGATDEGLAEQVCPLTQGQCSGALRQCQGLAGWTGCDYGPDYEMVESTCDGLDNDCDGLVDEDVAPLELCEDGQLRSDGLDNNCNGAVDEPGGCMVEHPSRNIYIDAYEAVVVENADCTGQRYGTYTFDDYPSDFPDQPSGSSRQLFACSLPGEIPSRNLTWHQASFACANQGKRLCTKEEWSEACQGSASTRFPYGYTYHPTVCNTFSSGNGAVVPTGSMPDCRNPEGMYDMSGNLWEWTQSECDWDDSRRFVQGGSFYCAFNEPDGSLTVCDIDNPEHEQVITDRHCCQRPMESSFCDFPSLESYVMGFRCCWDPN